MIAEFELSLEKNRWVKLFQGLENVNEEKNT